MAAVLTYYALWLMMCSGTSIAIEEKNKYIMIDLVNDNEETIANKIHDACTKFSWFYVINHNISQTMNGKLFEQSSLFFDLTMNEKLKISKNETHYGYLSDKSETHSSNQHKHDTKEVFHYQNEKMLNKDNISIAVQNQWPSSSILPHFEGAILSHFDILTTLAFQLNEYFALSLNLSKSYFNEESNCFDFNKIASGFRIIKYKLAQSNISNNVLGIGEHSDFGFFTILYSNNIKGLQFKNESNDNWYDVPFINNGYIVIIGDTFKRWTNDIYLSTKHRVVISDINYNRYSMVFFFSANYECIIKCLPIICNDQTGLAPKYMAITQNDYLKIKTREIYENAQQETLEMKLEL